MATTTTKFCTIADVKAALNVSASYDADDALIDIQVKQATALIREYTRREWEKGVYVDYFDSSVLDRAIAQGRGYVSLYLREKPVSTALAEYPTVKFNTGGNWLTTTDLHKDYYDVDPRLGAVVMYPQRMDYHGRSIQISYTAGYDISGDDPELCLVAPNLRTACAQQAAFSVRRSLNETAGTSGSRTKAVSRDYALTRSGLVAEAHALIRSSARILTGGDG